MSVKFKYNWGGLKYNKQTRERDVFMKLDKEAVLDIMSARNIQTQTELAQRLQMDKSQLSQMLSDDYTPIKSNVIKLMYALNCSLEDIVTEEKGNEILEETNTLYSVDEVKDIQQTKLFDLPETADDRFKYKLEAYTDVTKVKPKNQYSVLETFAGAGGLALGLEKASLNSVGTIELDKHASETLRQNRPEWNVMEADINEIAENGIESYEEFKNIKDLDVLSGGFPCQSFSYAGKGLGFEDTRGTLFYPYSQILKQIQPKIFLAENVKGLVNHDNGKTLFTMIKVFRESGYKVMWNVLNSWDYETAQKRERIVVIGIREDLVAVEEYSFKFPEPVNPGLVLKDILKDVPHSVGTTYSEKKHKILEMVPPGGCWVDLPEDVAKDYMGASWHSGGGKRGMARRMSWDEPSLTLTTSPSQKQTERCHPEETRPFTVREYARIQGFPDDWEFSGGVGAQYKQIGNAVPVNLAKYVGLAIVKYLNQFE